VIYVRFFTFFTLFSKSKNMTFYVLHTFSRIMCVNDSGRRFCKYYSWYSPLYLIITICRDVRPSSEARQVKMPLKYWLARRTVNPVCGWNKRLSLGETVWADLINVTVTSGRVGRQGIVPRLPDVNSRCERLSASKWSPSKLTRQQLLGYISLQPVCRRVERCQTKDV